MFKVCFVDDELINHTLMEQLIDWYEMGFVVVGVATDGYEALSLIEQQAPDVVFIDIKMPGMDGIECVEQIRKRDINIEIVLVTAFAEFDYAKKAISLGVSDYILKPVGRENLFSTVSEIRHKLQAKEEAKLLSELKHDDENYNRQNEILRFCKNVFYDEPIDMLNEKLMLCSPLFVCKLNFYNKDAEPLVPDDKLKKDIIRECDVYYIFVYNNTFVLFFESVIQPEQLIDITSTRDMHCDVYYLPHAMHISNMDTYQENLRVKNYAGFYYIGDKVYNLQTSPQFNTLKHDLHDIVKLFFDEHNYDYAKQKLKENFELFEKYLYEPTQVIAASRDLFATMTLRAKDFSKNSFINPDFTVVMQKIELSLKSKQLVNILMSQLQKIIDECFFSLQDGDKVSRVVEDAEKIARDNFSNSHFSIEEVAQKVFLSKNYFVTLYKKQTGKHYWNYVTNLRIDKAKELLCFTDKTVKHISSEIGYESEFHFSRKFKQMTTFSPAQFRALHNRNIEQ